MISAVTFHYQDKLTVIISPIVEQFFSNIKSSFSYSVETGGIIIGMLSSGPTITITDVTMAQSRDVHHKFRFFRSADGHQSLMDQLWEESGYRKMYLGEWHTHPEAIPSPSRVDICGWKSIAKKTQNTPWTLFIILGQQAFKIWTVENQTVKELTLGAK